MLPEPLPAPAPVVVTAAAESRITPEEFQTQLEARLESAVQEMRSITGGLEKFAETHGPEMQRLQMQFRELMSTISRQESPYAPVMLRLSRNLAVAHLLGAQHQAARNILLDSREAALRIHQEEDPEPRLAEHLLRLVSMMDDLDAKARQATSLADIAQSKLLMTPTEIKELLVQFKKSPMTKSSDQQPTLARQN